jgi:hypothetical protein
MAPKWEADRRLVGPELGKPAPEDNVLARNASLAHDAFAKPFDMGWLGTPREGGEAALPRGLVSQPVPERP